MNPFIFGKVVRGKYFADREEELDIIKKEVQAGQNLVLLSPRRFGKTSLVANAVENMEAAYLFIDMQLITGEDDLANILIKKALSLSRFERVKKHLKSLRVQPDFKYNPESGEFSIILSPEKKDIPVYLEDAFNLPEKVAETLNRKLVIIYDEFQELRRISPVLERKMRAVIQHHSSVSYIFIGSRQSMIMDIFSNRKNPFYKFARFVSLNKIPEKRFKSFIIKRFTETGIDAAAAINRIIKLTDNHPYYTQQLCHELCNLKESGKLNDDDIERAVNEIVTVHDADYHRWWGQADNTEKKILLGLSCGEKQFTSRTFLRKYGIESPSTASSAVKRLVEQGFAVRSEKDVKIEDPFWEIWIRKNRKLQI